MTTIKEARKKLNLDLNDFLLNSLKFLINLCEVGLGKTTQTLKVSLEKGYKVLYTHDSYNKLDEIYNFLINEIGLEPNDIGYVKSIYKIVSDLIEVENNPDKEYLETILNIIKNKLFKKKEPIELLKLYLERENKCVELEILKKVEKLANETTKNLDDKKIILVTKRYLLSPKFNSKLFGDNKKILIYDESGILTCEFPELTKTKKINPIKLKLNRLVNIDKKRIDEINFEINILNKYRELINEIDLYLNSILIKIDNSNFNIIKLFDKKTSIELFAKINRLILILNKNEPIDLKYYTQLDKIKLLDKLYQGFIKRIINFKIKFIKEKIIYQEVNNDKYFLEGELIINNYYQHKDFLNNLLLHQFTFIEIITNKDKNGRFQETKSNLKTANFKNFKKINELSFGFDKNTIIDSTFDKSMFDQLLNFELKKPQLCYEDYNDELISLFLDKNNLQYISSKLINKKTIIFHYSKISNENKENHFGKYNKKFWGNKHYMSMLQFTMALFKNYGNKILTITHKDKLKEFKDYSEVLNYPSNGIDGFKLFKILFLIGVKHFGNNNYNIYNLIFNENLPDDLKNLQINLEYIESILIESLSIQAIGRNRPFEGRKSIIYFGLSLKKNKFLEQFTYINCNKINLALIPLLNNKLQTDNEILSFDLKIITDEILSIYFKPSINQIKGNKKKENNFVINKEDFINKINGAYNFKNVVDKKSKIILTKLMLGVCKSVKKDNKNNGFSYLFSIKKKTFFGLN